MAEATYFVGTTSSVAGANKHHLTLMNSGGSGRLMKIYRVMAAGAPTAAVAGLTISLSAFRTSTNPTGGTALTIYEGATGQSVMVARSAIGMTGATNALTLETSPFGVGTVSGEEAIAGAAVMLYDFTISGIRPIEVAPGSGVTIRQGVLAAAGACNVSVLFSLA